MKLRPVGLGVAAMPLLGTDRSEELRFQRRRFGHLSRQWQAEPRRREPLQGQSDRRWRHIQPPSNLIAGYPGSPESKHFAHMAYRCPLCWYPLPFTKPKERTLSGPADTPSDRRLPGPTSSPIRGRPHPESAHCAS